MSAFGMKPTFVDYSGYQKWRSEWKALFQEVSTGIRKERAQLKELARAYASGQPVLQFMAERQRELHHRRVMGRKLMTLLDEAKIRWQNIKNMKAGLKEQMASFPMELGEARNIDFHFNKKHLEFDFVPMWTLKVKGKTFYVNHVDCNVPWTTRETPDNATTKGAIRIKRGTVSIDAEGGASIG